LDIHDKVRASNVKATSVDNECHTRWEHIWQKQKPNTAKSAGCSNNITVYMEYCTLLFFKAADDFVKHQ
jgi:hypothetical protein